MTEGFTYEFLPWRGVEKSTFSFYDVKTKIDSAGKPFSIGFKYPNDSYKVRSLTDKEFYSVKSPSGETTAGLFGRDKFAAGSHKYVTITEGELDALSLYQVIRSPCVSVRSSSSAQLDCTVDRSWLASFERIYICFDGDGPGRDAADKVARLFDYNKVYHVKLPGGNRKDANDYVRSGDNDALRNIWSNARKYLPETIISDLSTFSEILSGEPKRGLAYPWPTLDYMTYGIRTGETVLLTALEGVGKTEICHAIEYQALTKTEDAVAAIYVEEPKKRHLEALAGLELRQPVHLPDCDIPRHQVYAALQKVVGQDDRLHLYSHFGSDDPDVILDTIRFCVASRACRYVILDHISMVVSGLASKAATDALDYLSTRLEMMVKELDFALILVSHVNDEGLTRGSRNISKIADIRINLHRDVLSDDRSVRLTTDVVVGKNRYCGRTGYAGSLLFDPVTYTLSEVANDNGPTMAEQFVA
jgi:twinkle protein